VKDRGGGGGVGMHGSEWNWHITMTVSIVKIEDVATRSPWVIPMATCLHICHRRIRPLPPGLSPLQMALTERHGDM
jgi:hypothetical protein